MGLGYEKRERESERKDEMEGVGGRLMKTLGKKKRQGKNE